MTIFGRALLTLAATGVLALVALVPIEAAAQTPAPAQAPPAAQPPKAEEEGDITSEVEMTRAAIQLRRQALVTAAMDLEPKESDAFWPLYREYRLEMAKVGDRFSRLLTGYLQSYDTLTDEAARKLLDEYMSIERARNQVKSRYVGRFSKVMPAKKVVRFFQIDNKFDAVINAELAQTVPLAK
jgi:hypothetical protein